MEKNLAFSSPRVRTTSYFRASSFLVFGDFVAGKIDFVVFSLTELPGVFFFFEKGYIIDLFFLRKRSDPYI